MEKRNTLLLTVIAVATLLVAVVGATFAYFASNVQNTNVTNVTATTQASNAVFDATGNEISLTVTAASMQQALANNVAASASGNLNVTYKSGTNTNTNCTYDIYYQWVTQGDPAYTLTTAGAKEFTYAVSGALTVAETQFANANSTEHKVNTGRITIANASASTATTQTYTITVKFYNLPADQTAANKAGQTYKLKFYVKDVTC